LWTSLVFLRNVITVRETILRAVNRENAGGIRRIILAYIWQREDEKGDGIYYIIKKSCNNTERQTVFIIV
jgi:hypothetical protein